MREAAAIIGALSVCIASAPAWAHEEGDIVLGIVGGSLTTSFLSTDGHVFVSNLPAFPTEFDLHEGSLLAHHPRFLADAGTFSPGAEIGFNIRAPLSIWIGPGYAPIDPRIGPTLTVELASLGLSATTTSGPVPGFSVLADIEGGLAATVEYILNGPAGDDPEPGVYLLEIEFVTDMPGVGVSRPTWLVMNHGMDELTFETAFAYVFDFLVPAPGSIAVIFLPLIARRRRRF